MSVNKDKIVGYFEYDTEEMADTAITEQERIRRLEKQVDYNNPKLVYAIYNKILESNLFKTPEGILYMVHLQDYLYSKEDKINGPILPISYHGSNSLQHISDNNNDSQDKTPEDFELEIAKLKDKIRNLESDKSKAYRNLKIKNKKTDALIYKIIIAALVIVVIAMLIISSLSNSPNIINYRNEIQNEYSDWEQQLREKENELNARERELQKQQ